jgi:hypothetical protein
MPEEELCTARHATQKARALGSATFRRNSAVSSCRAERLRLGRPRKERCEADESRV